MTVAVRPGQARSRPTSRPRPATPANPATPPNPAAPAARAARAHSPGARRAAAFLLAALCGAAALALAPLSSASAAASSLTTSSLTTSSPTIAAAPSTAHEPSPESSPTAPAPAPTDATESIAVWVRLASDTSNVPNVRVKVIGPNRFSATVSTGPDGRAVIPLSAPGTYRVSILTSSLPPDTAVPKVQQNREVDVSLGNQGIPAFFLLSAATTSESPSDKPAGSASGGTDLSALILPRLASGLIFGLLLALAAIGVSLIYGTTGLNNFAHGELVTFGGLMGYVFSGIIGLPGWIGVIASIVLGAALGYAQDRGLWQPLRKRGVQLVPLMIVSIGLSLALRYLFSFIFGPNQFVLPADNSAALVLGPVRLRSTDMISAIISIVLLLLVAFVLLRTRIGRATRAVADNRSLAAASGINVERVIRLVWVGAGALAGLSGMLLGYYQTLRWDSGASILLLIFAAVTLGGLGTAFGALVGSIVIGLFVDLSTIVLPANLKYVSALLVMIVILLFRPQGILGKRDRIG